MILQSILLVLLLFYSIKITFSVHTKQTFLEQKIFLVLLFIIHFLMTIFAYQKISNDLTCDANRFYQNALYAPSFFSLLSFGSDFLSAMIYPFVQLKITMLTLCFLFSTLSYTAFLWYFQSFVIVHSQILKIFRIPITQWFLLLPSLHFWSSFLSKDALVFFFLTYIFVAKKKHKSDFFYCAFSAIIIAFIRPYVFVILLLVLLGWFLLNKQLEYKLKWFFLIVITAIIVVFIPVLSKFIRLEKITYQNVLEKYYYLNEFAKQGGTGINLVETNYVQRIIVLLFRPTFFDSNNTLYQLLVSLENFIILLFMIGVLSFSIVYKFKFSKQLACNLCFCASLGIILFVSTYIYNFGLASRMRLMFYPLLFYALHHIIFFKLRINNIK